MLGKMLLYDLKALSRPLIPIHIAVICAGVLCCLTGIGGYFSDEYYQVLDRIAPEASDFIMGIAIVVMALCFLLMLCAVVATFVLVLVRFYRNLFTDEGYLTLTLPLKPWQQLMSKVLAGMIWLLIDALVVMACLTAATIAAEGFDIPALDDALPIWILKATGNTFLSSTGEVTDVLQVAGLWLGTILQMLFALLLAYASLCLGAALAAKHKLAAGIGILVGVWFVYGMVTGFISVTIALGSLFDWQMRTAIMNAVNQCLELGMIAGCWFICIWVLKRRINLT